MPFSRILESFPLRLAASPAPGTTDARLWLLALVFFAAAFFFYTRGNVFPPDYHPDEPSKVRQILEEDYNFRHPMLLLRGTEIARRISGAGETEWRIAVAGRSVSAMFCAGAVALLVVLAGRMQGWFAAFAVGLLLLVNHQFFELAHYMKEDPALTFGTAATLLAIWWYSAGPSRSRAVVLGIACGLALSGKYPGALLIPFVFLAVAFQPGPTARQRLANAGLTLLGLVAVFAIVNWPMFSDLDQLSESLAAETSKAVDGHKEMTRAVPHGVYFAVLRQSINAVALVLLGIYAVTLILRARRTPFAEWLIALYPATLFAVLTFLPKTHHRYFLPATAVFIFLAAIGLARIPGFRWHGKALAPRHATLLVWVLLISSTLASVYTVSRYVEGFTRDNRVQLARYIREELPADAIIVQDRRVQLPTRDEAGNAPPSLRTDRTIIDTTYSADEGTLDELRARGVTHIAVAEGDYGRFFLRTHRAKDDQTSTVDRRRAFYELLFRDGTKLWEARGGAAQYLQITLELYEMPPPTTQTSP